MDNPPQKKGLGALGWLGIGCGGIVVLGIIGVVLFFVFFGGKMKDFAEDAVKNPTRAGAAMVVNMGLAEWVAQDDDKKIYTIKEKQSGKVTTFYWSKKKNGPEQVEGDATAVPADDLGVPPTVDLKATPAPPPPPQ